VAASYFFVLVSYWIFQLTASVILKLPQMWFCLMIEYLALWSLQSVMTPFMCYLSAAVIDCKQNGSSDWTVPNCHHKAI